ncbi:uncharacterized protein BKA78DRAFT_293206 [Phyllosticta capitalensis]|uniref:uncharacterized protein n=1 Tax=Phyllosticta capitalensis TaxID=121624 RepID=UPI00312E4F16
MSALRISISSMTSSFSSSSPMPVNRSQHIGIFNRSRRDTGIDSIDSLSVFESEANGVAMKALINDYHYSYEKNYDGSDEDEDEEADKGGLVGIGLHGIQVRESLWMKAAKRQWLIKRDRCDTSVLSTELSSSSPMVLSEQRPAINSTYPDVQLSRNEPPSSPSMLLSEDRTTIVFPNVNSSENMTTKISQDITMNKKLVDNSPRCPSAPRLSSATLATSSSYTEVSAMGEKILEGDRLCPPQAPRLSRAVPIPSSSPNVPPPYVRLPVHGPIYYHWESLERKVQDHIGDYLEAQHRRREEYHHYQKQMFQQAQPMTPQNSRSYKITHHRNHHADANVSAFSALSSNNIPLFPVSSSLITNNGSSPAHQGSLLVYDTSGTIYSSPVPPKKGFKRVRFRLDHEEREFEKDMGIV